MTIRNGGKLIQAVTKKAQRVVSTSATSQQSAHVLTAEDLSQQTCPFKKTLDKFENILASTSSDNNVLRLSENKIQSFEHVPGPKGLPIVGTLFDYFKKDGLRFSKMFEAYQKRAIEFGPIYKEKIASISTIVISDPSEYNKVIRAERKYPNRREMEPMAHYRRKKNIDLGLVNALNLSLTCCHPFHNNGKVEIELRAGQGEEWHKFRTVVSKKMLKIKEVLDYCEEMDIVADDFMTHLKTRTDQHHQISGLETDIFKWAMESIGTFLFEERIGCLGQETPPLAQEFIENLQGFFKLMQPLMYNLPLYKIFPTKTWRQYENYTDNILKIGRTFVDKKVQQLQSTESLPDDKTSFLTYLMQSSLTPEEALSTAVDLLVGATETTTTGSLWVLYSLAKNPKAQEKMYKEIKEVLPNNEAITPDKISKLPYVKAVVKETFRLYPITFATSRHIEDDLEVGGYMIPAGSHVQANLYGMFHDPKLFPDPEAFIPERWIDGEMDRTLKSLSNLVWGHGARMCIGRRFAEQEMHIMLTKIIQNFKLEYHYDDIEPVLNTVMTPDRPLKLSFKPRSS